MYWTGGVLALVILAYYFRSRVKSETFKYSGKTDEWKKTVSNAPASLDGNKLLKKGSSGAEVTALQIAMKSAGADLGKFGPAGDGIDGVFGSKTEAALMVLRGVKETTLNQFSKTVAQTVIEQVKDTTGAIYN